MALRFPRGPAREIVNRGCQSLPCVESWERAGVLRTPGQAPFSEDEFAARHAAAGVRAHRGRTDRDRTQGDTHSPRHPGVRSGLRARRHARLAHRRTAGPAERSAGDCRASESTSRAQATEARDVLVPGHRRRSGGGQAAPQALRGDHHPVPDASARPGRGRARVRGHCRGAAQAVHARRPRAAHRWRVVRYPIKLDSRGAPRVASVYSIDGAQRLRRNDTSAATVLRAWDRARWEGEG